MVYSHNSLQKKTSIKDTKYYATQIEFEPHGYFKKRYNYFNSVLTNSTNSPKNIQTGKWTKLIIPSQCLLSERYL